ncbi:CAP domain-containing protein [Streptomyces sp. H27-C3]|uniref:CAP domain-containing protein n=1 Tax=Streptomyces sp. H27-C3 TaxID=3046305 RepID=UPI0024BA540A|nr:CAP domain-containing protein [Streptomyces sp. H27-C3]MDJ0460887.1 CAP domain-containing protein [Streptomyces sp. H27-C3]
MGRHRRSAAGPAAADHADGRTGSHRGGGRRKRRAAPVRTGLLGVSAAVAMGAVAVASGLLPGGENFSLGGDSGAGERVRANGPADLDAQGGSSAEPTGGASPPADRPERAHAPSKSPSPKPPKPSTTPSERETVADSKTEKPADQKDKARESDKSSEPAPSEPAPPRTPPATESGDKAGKGVGSGAASTAEAAVLTLVNQERSKAGCTPVRPNQLLAKLAGDFSQDMAARGFFDHTDPDGATPWDRADKAGIDDLGGENIARGQADARSVMDAWMKSEGHRANILNCDYKTLGVGVHIAGGGPWWTQDFGF